MNALMTFLDMGGYGGYVWSAFAITAIVLAANIIYAWQQKRRALRRDH
ncbi:MAG: heme exporter protein CcmD [Gammaproteobacteria bacterium]